MQQEHGQAEYQVDKGGRIKELESGEILVDEFKPRGTKATTTVLERTEELYQRYGAKLEVVLTIDYRVF